MIKYITIFFYLLFLNVSAEEYFKFSSADKKFPNHSEVIVEISFPKKITGKLPLIITQHGSTRDGKKIQDGATDEYSKRIIKEGTKQGFAVATLFELLIAFSNATFGSPSSQRYPSKNKISLFLTAFLSISFSLIFPAVPRKVTMVLSESGVINIKQVPVEIIKGEESHYYIEPCKILEKELLKAGNKVKLVNIPKVNHFFSTNGKIIKGVAVNGCRYDPIIKMPDGKSFLYSGTEISRKEARKRCFTNEAGKGKNRKKLNEAVNLTITFFKDNLN